MTTSVFTRDAADAFVAALEPLTRSAPLPDANTPPVDPEALKEQILAEAREALDWDGTGGDPNESLAALETALADMFDADVEITWDGDTQMTLTVEGEEPMPLNVVTLGQLLEALAKSGALNDGADDEPDDDEPEGDEAEPEPADGSTRIYWPGERGGVVDKHGHLHGEFGDTGGQFVSKGAMASAAKKAVSGGGKASGKAAGKPAGTKVASTAKAAKAAAGKAPAAAVHRPAALAKRAEGRAGGRATAKAVGETLSAGTGTRVRVSANPDGTFKVGGKKRLANGLVVSAAIFATWFAAGTAAGFLAPFGGLPALAPLAAGVAGHALILAKLGAPNNPKIDLFK